MRTTLPIDPATATIYAEGWQSWTPTRWYSAAESPERPVDDNHRRMGYGVNAVGDSGFAGLGLLAVRPDPGEPLHTFSTTRPDDVPTIRANVHDDAITVESVGGVEQQRIAVQDDTAALSAWAIRFARRNRLPQPRAAPTVWCSWYRFFTEVRESDIDRNLAAIDACELAVDVVQIDDGYQSEIGDWLVPSGRFPDLAATIGRIRAAGRRAGIWLAPFLVGERATLARDHPDWLLPGADPGRNWGQRLHVLDVAHPAVVDYWRRVFEHFMALGIDYFKLDFLYAGALTGERRGEAIARYRGGLGLVRDIVGADAYLAGSGAPTLASAGLVDAMRVSPDTAPYAEAPSGDASSPGLGNAIRNGAARQWQNHVLWTNDPDCLLARPEVAERARWASHLNAVDGLRSVSDDIEGLDDWGLSATRSYLAGPARP